MADRKLSGDYDGKSYMKRMHEEGEEEMEEFLIQNMAGRKVDGNFYGHIKSGSHKASKNIKGAC